jgi:Nucleotidyl transferase AbiEii toxin, Type IV TA system
MLHLGTVEPLTLELLRTLTNDPMLANNFLVGGTSLSLQLGHRKSVDLDLFTHEPFDGITLLRHLQEHSTCPRINCYKCHFYQCRKRH